MNIKQFVEHKKKNTQ